MGFVHNITLMALNKCRIIKQRQQTRQSVPGNRIFFDAGQTAAGMDHKLFPKGFDIGNILRNIF